MSDKIEFNVRDTEGKKQVIQIIQNDENFLICNKPSGVRALPDFWNPESENLMDLINNRVGDKLGAPLEKELCLFELERPVSGLVIFAKSKDIFKTFQNKIKVYYSAVARGQFKDDNRVIEQGIQPRSRHRRHSKIDESGIPAKTEYWVKDRFEHYSLLELFCHTEVPHQIQAHLMFMNTPLAVDTGYGSPRKISIEDFKRRVNYQKHQDAGPAIMSRITLHARRAEIPLPGGKANEVIADYPKDFRALLNVLKKYD